MAKINFFIEDIPFTLNNKTKIRNWIEETITDNDFSLAEINYIFCSDQYLHDLNVKYLNHDTLTDIITFDQSDEESEVKADIFISIERVKENAKKLKVLFLQELHRVMIHGVLHLLGYGDKTDSEKKVMRERENAYISLLHNKN